MKPSNRILEIGTGASAIISLFAAKSFDLKVLATEINESSIDSAERNISTNNMSHKIQLLKSEGGILDQVIEIGSSFDALTAGQTPKISPTERDTLNPVTTAHIGIEAGMSGRNQRIT